MVKKIRKRIEKEQPETEETPLDELDIDEGAPEGFVADIERFAEDSLTRGIVNVLKMVHQYGKVIVAVSALGLGGFAFNQLSDMSQQEEISTKQTVVATALAAMEAGRGLSSDASGEKGAELDDAAKKGKLELAEREFQRIAGGTPLVGGAIAAAQLELGQADKALTTFGSAEAAASGDQLIAAMAIAGKASALEAANKPSKAIEAWQTLEKLDSRYAPMAALAQAKLLERSGDGSKAVSILKKVDTAKLPPFGVKTEIARMRGLLAVEPAK